MWPEGVQVCRAGRSRRGDLFFLINKFIRSFVALGLGVAVLALASGPAVASLKDRSTRPVMSTLVVSRHQTSVAPRAAAHRILTPASITGPVASPPGGVSEVDSGSGPAMMENGGQTFTFSGIDMSRFDNLWWGPYDTASSSMGLSACDPFTFNSSQPDLANGVAHWSAPTNSAIQWGFFTCTFTLTVTDSNGSAIPLVASTDVGLTQGAVVRVPATGGFKANIRMQIDGQSDTISWFNIEHAFYHEPACTGGSTQYCFQDDFTGGWFYQPDAPSAVATDVTVAEGAAFSGTVGTITDADPTAQASEYAASIDWGDGSTSAGTVTGPVSGQFDISGGHTWADEGSYALLVWITDSDNSGANMLAGATATVTEADGLAGIPISITTDATGHFTGTVATFNYASPVGPAADFPATINWGDGVIESGNVADTGTSLAVGGSHHYLSTGAYSVAVHIEDDGAGTAAADASGTATFSPAAAPDSYSGTAGGSLVVAAPGVLQNDTGATTASLSSSPSHGSLTLNADGSFTYSPNAGFSGTDSFQYTACHSGACSDPATVSLTIAPVAGGDSYSTPYQTTLNVSAPGVLANDTGTSLTAAETSGPSHGTLTLNANGSLSYAPNSGFSGADGFSYQACTGTLCSTTAAVSITVGTPAFANPDSYTDGYGQRLVVAAPGVLGNDTGTGLVVTGTPLNPHHGALTLRGNGSFTYIPDAGFSGQDSFTYSVTDSQGQVSNAVVTVSVLPVGAARTYTTTANHPRTVAAPGVLKGAKGFSSLSAAVVSGPSHGTLTLNPNGSFTYTPAAGFSGIDTFTYSVTDAHGAVSLPATITIDVVPVAVKDSYKTKANSSLHPAVPGVLGNDIGIGLHTSLVSGPANGTLTLNPDGSFTYIPTPGSSGKDSFTYSAVDSSSLASAPVTVSITILPVAVADSYVTSSNVPLIETAGSGVLANDIGTTLVLGSLTSAPIHGSLTISSDGSFTYVPEAGYVGSDSFKYTCRDASGNLSAPVTVTISIT